jgi:PilZ domain-containing protein
VNDNLRESEENRTQRRSFKRLRVDLSGRLFVPAESRESPCTVANISVGGAAIECETPAERGTHVVLYVDGFGRFEGKVVRQNGSTLGIRFDSTALKRERVAEQLNRFENKAPMENSVLRRHERHPAAGSTHYTRADGQRVPCRVLDLSPGGVNVKTGVHPPLGEYVLIGQMAGRVVRHHELGVGIEFVGGPAAKEYGEV